MRRRGLPLSLAVALLGMATASRAQTQEDFDDLEDLYAWGAVSSVLEVDEDGDPAITGFFLHTDQGESFEIIMDDLGRALAKEASDRTDLVVEVEGVLSVDRLMVTILEFRLVFVDPADLDGTPEN